MSDHADSLSRVPIFASLGSKDREKLASQMSERTFAEGEAVATEGQSGVGFFLIEEGTATVSIGGNQVRTIGPGEWFGEVALIDNGPRSASIVAETELRCRGLTVWEFRPFVQGRPEVAWPLLEVLASRLREAEARRGEESAS